VRKQTQVEPLKKHVKIQRKLRKSTPVLLGGAA
jgi:hypothetical protein